jgi:hypothetical protein
MKPPEVMVFQGKAGDPTGKQGSEGIYDVVG